MTRTKIILVLCIIGGFALILGGCTVGKYNTLVGEQEGVDLTWNDLQSAYQRRSDLIPNLVNVVKGYAKHESETLTGVVAARAKATQVVLPPDANPEQIAAFRNAQGELSQALGRLLAVTENYPELRANQNFSELQAQLEGTENRINESRKRYNAAVKNYNVLVRSFPTNIVAKLFDFQKKEGFEADDNAQKAPEVNF